MTFLARLQRNAQRGFVQIRGQRVVAVLGMHRSGTSSLAGSLEAGGLYLGGKDVGDGGRWNRKGNRESKTLLRLHEQLLRENGGSWREPPQEITWDDDSRAVRDRFIRSRATQRIWGFKDPRTVLLTGFWLEALPRLELIGTIREPIAVARSLERRHPTGDVAGWLELWRIYNQHLLESQREYGFTILDFDLSPAAYESRLDAVMHGLGLTPPAAGDDFFEPELRHESAPDDGVAVPENVASLYGELRAIAVAQADESAVPSPR